MKVKKNSFSALKRTPKTADKIDAKNTGKKLNDNYRGVEYYRRVKPYVPLAIQQQQAKKNQPHPFRCQFKHQRFGINKWEIKFSAKKKRRSHHHRNRRPNDAVGYFYQLCSPKFRHEFFRNSSNCLSVSCSKSSS